MVESKKIIFEMEGIEPMTSNAAFVRITRPYDELVSLVSAWCLKCEKIIVYEHVGEETEKVHVHILMCGMVDSWDNFKKIAKKLGHNFNGNEDWCKTKKYVYNSQDTIKYMSKGVLDPKYNKGYTQEEIESAKKLWTPEAVVMSKDQALYNKFVEMHEGCEDWEFSRLKTEAKRFAFWECSRLWTPRASAIYRLIMYTHAMTFNIDLPEQLEVKM